MRYSMQKVIDEIDQILIDRLHEIGMPKTMARVVVCLQSYGEASAHSIELSTGLRQPEVSFALSRLISQKFVGCDLATYKGKGRPTFIYKSIAPIGDIINVYEMDMKYKVFETRKAYEEYLRVLNDGEDIDKENINAT